MKRGQNCEYIHNIPVGFYLCALWHNLVGHFNSIFDVDNCLRLIFDVTIRCDGGDKTMN